MWHKEVVVSQAAIQVDFGDMIASKSVIGLWACMEYLRVILLDCLNMDNYLTVMLGTYLKLLVYPAAILEDFRGVMFVGAVRLRVDMEGSEVIFQDFRDTFVSKGVP
eukprot:s1232_g19.t1